MRYPSMSKILLPLLLVLNLIAFMNCAKDGSTGSAGSAGPSGLSGQSVSSVSAHYINGASQLIPDSAMTKINFDTKVHDTNDSTATGANWAFTAPTTGLYIFSVSVRFGTGCHWTGGTFRQLQLVANGSTVVGDLDYQTDIIIDTRPVTLRGSTAIRLTANDSISAQVYQNTGHDCPINTGIATSISIARIGD